MSSTVVPIPPRDRGQILDEIAVFPDAERAAVLRAGRHLPTLGHGLLAFPVSVRAAEPEPRLPETLGDEERFDGAELKRVSDLLLPIRRQAAVLLADLLHEPLHKRFLAHQVEAAQDLPRLLDELSQAVLVRVTGVEERGQDLFLQLVMEIIAGREFFLRVARSAD